MARDTGGRDRGAPVSRTMVTDALPVVPERIPVSEPGQNPYEPYQAPQQQPYGQPPQSPYGYPPQQPYGYAPSRGTNGLAIASLVTSLIWVCGVSSIAAVVCGHIARNQIKRTGEQGAGMALAGLIIGYLGIAVVVVYFIVVVVVVANDPDAFE